MNNTAYDTIMENLRNRINVRIVNNKKDYSKWASKSSYMSQKISDNELAATRKSKVTLKLNKASQNLTCWNVKIIIYEPIKSTKFCCHTLMIKC